MEILTWIRAATGWILTIWTIFSVLVGGTLFLIEELRWRRTAPQPETVRVYADRLLAAHGSAAFLVNSQAWLDARLARDKVARRFLAEVTNELARRLSTDEIMALARGD